MKLWSPAIWEQKYCTGNEKPQLLLPNVITVSKRMLPRRLPEGCRARWLCVRCAGEHRAWSLCFLSGRWLERFQMLDCLQNETFRHGIDPYYFNPLSETAATLLGEGPVPELRLGYRQSAVSHGHWVISNLGQIKRLPLCSVLWLAQWGPAATRLCWELSVWENYNSEEICKMHRQDVRIKRVLDQCETEKSFWEISWLNICYSSVVFHPPKKFTLSLKHMHFFLSVGSKHDGKVKIRSCSS